MTFVSAICTEEVFAQLALPDSLKGDERMNPVGHRLVFSFDARSALVPHPYHYADYPDRSLSFYVDGEHYAAFEYVERSDGPDRVEIGFAKSAHELECQRITALLADALAMLRNEPTCSIPVVARRNWN